MLELRMGRKVGAQPRVPFIPYPLFGTPAEGLVSTKTCKQFTPAAKYSLKTRNASKVGLANLVSGAAACPHSMHLQYVDAWTPYRPKERDRLPSLPFPHTQ